MLLALLQLITASVQRPLSLHFRTRSAVFILRRLAVAFPFLSELSSSVAPVLGVVLLLHRLLIPDH